MNRSYLNQGKLLLALAALGGGTAGAVEHTYEYFRFTPIATRSAAIIQISEFQFFDAADNPIATTGVTVTSGSTDHPAGEAPPNAFDGNNLNKWLNFNHTNPNVNLVFHFPAPTTIDHYNFVTGNDVPARDPASWRFEGSPDGTSWTTIDEVAGFVAPFDRNVVAAAEDFVFPASPPPSITTFEFYDNAFLEAQVAIVPNGSLGFFVEAENATTLTITPGTGSPVAANNFLETLVPLPDNMDSVVTLEAGNTSGTVSESLFVRTVEPGTRDVRYVRFTPLKVRASLPIEMAEFKFFDGSGTLVPVVDVANDGGSVPPDDANLGALNLIDGDDFSIWSSDVISDLVFDLGSVTTIASYSYVTGDLFPESDPVQWLLEGSTDGTTWIVIDSMSGSFDFPAPMTRGEETQMVPLPADDSIAPVVDFELSVPSISTDETVTLTWDVALADTVEIQPGLGVVASSGSMEVSGLTADTVFTLTATSSGGRVIEVTRTLIVGPTFTDGFTYPDFDNPSGVIPVGSTYFVNDFETYPNDPDAARMRVTDLTGSQMGAAWFYRSIDLTGGFQTAYTLGISHPSAINGADGLSFVVQNIPDSLSALPDQALFFSTTNGPSLAVTIDTFLNGTEPSNAFAEVFVNGVSLQRANLTTAGLGVAKGSAGNFMVTGVGGGANNYDVVITYQPGDLDMTIDGVVVFDSLAVDLGATGSAVLDASGEAFVGFVGRTGGLEENHDILDWTLTTDLSMPSELAITDYSFDFSGSPATLALTWTSQAGTDYLITTFDGVSDWTPVGAAVSGQAGTTTTTVDIPMATTGLFRVEEAGM